MIYLSFRQNNEKLFAAVPARKIVISLVFGYYFSEGTENIISRLVSVIIINITEMVYGKQNDCYISVIPDRQPFMQEPDHHPFGVKSGKRINGYHIPGFFCVHISFQIKIDRSGQLQFIKRFKQIRHSPFLFPFKNKRFVVYGCYENYRHLFKLGILRYFIMNFIASDKGKVEITYDDIGSVPENGIYSLSAVPGQNKIPVPGFFKIFLFNGENRDIILNQQNNRFMVIVFVFFIQISENYLRLFPADKVLTEILFY